jgi:hypothetical protein
MRCWVNIDLYRFFERVDFCSPSYM